MRCPHPEGCSAQAARSSRHYTHRAAPTLHVAAVEHVGTKQVMLQPQCLSPLALSIVMTSPAVTFSLLRDSIILVPRSYTVSISVVFRVNLPYTRTRTARTINRMCPRDTNKPTCCAQYAAHRVRPGLHKRGHAVHEAPVQLEYVCVCVCARGARACLTVLATAPASGLSISISTTSPSMISVSSLIRTPIAFLNACVSRARPRAYTLL